MNKIIIQPRFTAHQTVIILLLPLIFVGVLIADIKLALNRESLYSIAMLLISLVAILFAFIKKGFLVENDTLYQGYFLFGIKIYSSLIDTSTISKIAILKFRKTQKLPWFSVAKPDLATDFKVFEVNLLNEKHTKRLAVIDIIKEEKVASVISFLTSNLPVTLEEYRPDFS